MWYLALLALAMVIESDGRDLVVRGFDGDVEICECMDDLEWVYLKWRCLQELNENDVNFERLRHHCVAPKSTCSCCDWMDAESDSVAPTVLDWSSEDGEAEQPATMEADMESDVEFEQPANSAFLRRRIHCKR